MALLVDKYRPKSLDALSFHKDLSIKLQALVGFSFCAIRQVDEAIF